MKNEELENLRRIIREISSVREPIERTLIDVREILSSIDNPFQLIEVKRGNEVQEREGNGERHDESPHGVKIKASPSLNNQTLSDTYSSEIVQRPRNHKSVRSLNAMTCSILLASLLGKIETERLIYSLFRRRGSLSEEMKSIVEFLNNFSNGFTLEVVKTHARNGNHNENLLLSVTLLSMLEADPEDPMISFLALSIMNLLSGS